MAITKRKEAASSLIFLLVCVASSVKIGLMSRLSHVYVQYLLVFPGSALDHLYFDTTSSLRLVSERRLSIVLFHGLCPLPMLLVFYPVYSCFL